MHKLLYSFIALFFFCSCADRPRLPTEIEIVSEEPSVANVLNDFSFEITAQYLYYNASYPVEFNSNIVTVYVTVSNYSEGTGTLVLNGIGNSLIFSHSLSANQNQEFRLSGENVPQKIQLAFSNFRGQVRIHIEVEPG